MSAASEVPESPAVQIVVVDMEGDLPELRARAADGSMSAAAWLVVRSGGAPVALVPVQFGAQGVIRSAEVRSCVELAVGAAPVRLLPVVRDADLPRVSVVIPTDLGRPEQLRACLLGLHAQDHPEFEVLVVDNSRTGASRRMMADLVAGLARVRVVREPVPGISAARNAGIAAAQYEIVAFTDDDVRVDPGWVRALAARFAVRPGEDAVTGLILPGELRTQAQVWFEQHFGGFGGARTFAALTFRGPEPSLGLGRRSQVVVLDWAGEEVRRFTVYGAGVAGAGANMAFRARALEELGPFDVALGTGTPARGGEDLDMMIRLLWRGGALGYEPAAVVFHTHRADLRALRRQVHGYGLGFTAMLTSLVASDPRHLVEIAAQLPAVVRPILSRTAVVEGDSGRGAIAPSTQPPPGDLRWLGRAGLLRGPGAYAYSRLLARRRMRRR